MLCWLAFLPVPALRSTGSATERSVLFVGFTATMAESDFSGSCIITGIVRPDEFRTVTRAHIIAWRDDLVRRGLGGSTQRMKSRTAFSYARRVLGLLRLANHSTSGGNVRQPVELDGGQKPVGGGDLGRKLVVGGGVGGAVRAPDRKVVMDAGARPLYHWVK